MSDVKPDWSNAPEWANYWAFDADGQAFWFEEEPNVRYDMYLPSEGYHESDKVVGVDTEYTWIKSLQARPEKMTAPFEVKASESLSNWQECYEAKPSAASILEAGLGHMKDRAATYDAEGGERSMSKTVECFNALTGRDLTETEGWLMMVCLKLARANQGGFRMDSFEDGAAYIALMGESAALQQED